jgi:peptidoglycan/LPS O-acetylase OafA/YrhL
VRFDPIVRPEMPELDTIRGIAILLVVFYHGFYWLSGLNGFTGVARAAIAATMPGWLGVNLFFVLSGFLITGILLDSKTKENYFRSFYLKRVLRILPAYYGLLLVLLLVGLRPRSFLLISFFFLANFATLFGVVSSYSPLWSLAVEEHFYLIWPSVVRACSIRTLERCTIGIVCLVPAIRAGSFMLGWTEGIHGYTWCEADGLVLGAWLAINIRKPEFTRERLAWISATAVGIALFGALAGAPFGILTRQRLLGASFQESCGNFGF